MRVLIAVPTFDTVLPDTFKSLWDLDRAGHEVGLEVVRGYGCAMARNRIAEMTLEGGWDACLMVDSDMVLPPDALALLAEPGAPIRLGCCPRHGDASVVECYWDHGENYGEQNRMSAAQARELAAMGIERVAVKGGGLACGLVTTEALREIPRPWFRYVEYGNGDVLSEDLFFCEQAAAAAVAIEADVRVRCGHSWRQTWWA